MQRIQGAGYQHARQACYLCLSPNDGVDTEVQIDYEGVLFLCRNCIGGLAMCAGFRVDEDRQPEVDKLKAKIADLECLAGDQDTAITALVKDQHNHRKMAEVRAAKVKA